MQSLYESEDWLVIDKPTGISTHGAWGGDLGVVEWLNLHEQRTLFVVSRLDNETSGVLLFARNRQASGLAEKQHLSGEAEKLYTFFSASALCPESWVCEEPLDGKPARTEFQRIDFARGVVQIEARIRSGRTHQIRRHAAISHVPILGDTRYGGMTFPRLCLHCHELRWPGLAHAITSSLPPSLEALCKGEDVRVAGQLAALDRRQGVFQGLTDAWRLVHRGECGKFAIDRFSDSWCAWLYASEERGACEEMIRRIAEREGLRNGVLKILERDPHHKGALCRNEYLSGYGKPDDQLEVNEQGVRYLIRLNEQEQTGFFLDQRDNRQWARKLLCKSGSARIANLFAYTCSFTVALAQDSPEVIMSVDLSKSALREGLENLQLNGLEGKGNTKVIQEDVRSWLARQSRKQADPGFDLVICDPPTFGKTSGGQAFRVGEEWLSLAQSVKAILKPDGSALFCTNSRSLATDWLESHLQSVFPQVVRHRTPLDFPEAVDPRHNRCFWVRKIAE